MEVVDKKMTLVEAFKVADSVLSQGVQGISDIITVPGLINVDFADVSSVMSEAGSALLGIGTGVGDKRAQAAARAAIASPLLDLSIEGAKGILFNIIGGPDLTMMEVDEAANLIGEMADADASIRFGATIDEHMVDQIKIIVVATGFNEASSRLAKMVSRTTRPPLPEGIIGERLTVPQAVPSIQTEANEEMTQEPPNGEVDEFGEKFEIPAFLRQGK